MEAGVVFAFLYCLSNVSFNSGRSDVEGPKEFLTLDDQDNFVNNDGYKGFDWDHLQWMWESKHLDVWEPLAWLLKAGVWYFFDLDPRYWLAVQILFHAIGGTLLFVICRLMFSSLLSEDRQSAFFGCAFGATLWTLHPLRAEAVGWISCISYNFAVVFVAASLILYYHYLVAINSTTKVTMYLASLVCFAGGLACKTPTVATIFGYLFIDAFTRPQRLLPVKKWIDPRGAVADKIIFAAVALGCLYIAAPSDDPCGNERTAGLCLSVQDRFIRGCWALAFYVRMTVWPEQHMPHYAIEYGKELNTNMDFEVATYIIPSVIVPLLTTVSVLVFLQQLAVLASRPAQQSTEQTTSHESTPSPKPFSARFLASAAWIFLVTWSLPAIGIIQHGVLTMGADRYHYLPAIVIVPIGAGAFERFRRKFSLMSALLGAGSVLVMLVILTRAASRPWTNTVALYTNSQRFRATNTGFALNNFGYWLV